MISGNNYREWINWMCSEKYFKFNEISNKKILRTEDGQLIEPTLEMLTGYILKYLNFKGVSQVTFNLQDIKNINIILFKIIDKL